MRTTLRLGLVLGLSGEMRGMKDRVAFENRAPGRPGRGAREVLEDVDGRGWVHLGEERNEGTESRRLTIMPSVAGRGVCGDAGGMGKLVVPGTVIDEADEAESLRVEPSSDPATPPCCWELR